MPASRIRQGRHLSPKRYEHDDGIAKRERKSDQAGAPEHEQVLSEGEAASTIVMVERHMYGQKDAARVAKPRRI